MNIKPGTFLISAPSLDDPNFEKVVIFICEHNEKGAMGFVINKLFPRKFNELAEFQHSVPVSLYDGGPVEKEHLFFLHRQPDVIEGGTQVTGTVYLGGNFEQAVRHMTLTTISETDIKLFIGYCGWDCNELEAEVEEGSWLVADAAAQLIFSHHREMLWEELCEGMRL